MARSVNRSARTGRFVSKATASRWPSKTTREAVGSGTSNKRTVTRSAATGRFVPKGRGDSDPGGTIRQRV
ncbi:ABC transporter ATP-binding protein [Kocuria arenosa]|uniref:ABC transporter ATP-binding protein n=1 Tax=Kocuria arenosa TaxID=3071446 RepID=UPI0034D3E9D5